MGFFIRVLLTCASVLSRVSVMAWPVAHQALLSRGFSRQEYLGELPFPSPGDLLNLDPACTACISCIGGWILYHWVTWEACFFTLYAEKAMAPHSSTLAWELPWTEEPGRLQSMGSRRVGQDWATSLSLFTFMHWRRKWQPTSVFLPGESQGLRSLVGYHLWGRTELDMIEAT